MTNAVSLEEVIKNILDEEIPDYVQREVAQAIKQHYLGKLPKEKEHIYVSLRTGKVYNQGYNQALADVRKVIGGEDDRD